MSEKATLLPTVVDNTNSQFIGSGPQYAQMSGPRIILLPGLEFDARRRHNYGYSALFAALLIFLSWLIVESRACYVGPGLDMDRLQGLHLALMMFAFILFLLSLFGFADFIFQFKIFFSVGVLTIYVAAGLMIWATYLAAVSPCKSTFNNGLVDLYPFKTNVFNAGDAFGIVVLLFNIVASILMVAAASSFYKRY